MTLNAFDHYTVRCADLQTSWRFYQDVLQLTVVEHPGAPMPAAIVSLGDLQVVHLFQATPEQDAIFAKLEPTTDQATAEWRTGRLHHVGFWATGIAAFRDRLRQHSIRFRERTMPDKHQFIIRDPDKIEIEINFPLSELPA